VPDSTSRRRLPQGPLLSLPLVAHLTRVYVAPN